MLNKIILGTVQLGIPYGINNKQGQPSLNEAFSILDYAYKSGIEILDTAAAYGSAIDVIGKYHKEHSQFKIITKFHAADGPVTPNTVSKSMEKLGVNNIYAYLFHSYSDFYNSASILTDIETIKQIGIIKNIGVSVYTNDEFENVIESDIIDLIQLPFNLLDNRNKRGFFIDKAIEAKKIIHIRSCFLQGLFFMDANNLPEKLKPLKKYLLQLKDIAKQAGITINQLALSYNLQCSNAAGVLIGVDTKVQLQENIDGIVMLNDETIAKINSIDVRETELLNPVNWK
jgi:aryl-alcohol dehydrogenase-like predicted oxidoreductase